MGSLSDAIAAQGYSALLPLTDLASVHIMLYFDVLPSGSGKWLAVDNSETHLTQLVKRTLNKSIRQLFEHHDHLTMVKKTVNTSIRQLFEHSDHLTMVKRVVNKLLRSAQIVENFETNIRQSVHKHVKNVRTTHEGDVVQLHQTRNFITNNYEAGVTIAYQGTNYPANKLELAGLYAEDLGYQ